MNFQANYYHHQWCYLFLIDCLLNFRLDYIVYCIFRLTIDTVPSINPANSAGNSFPYDNENPFVQFTLDITEQPEAFNIPNNTINISPSSDVGEMV